MLFRSEDTYTSLRNPMRVAVGPSHASYIYHSSTSDHLRMKWDV